MSEERQKPAFEVYTLNNTIIVHADNLQAAIWQVDQDQKEEEVIGVIEVSLFHKRAVQRPDLV